MLEQMVRKRSNSPIDTSEARRASETTPDRPKRSIVATSTEWHNRDGNGVFKQKAADAIPFDLNEGKQSDSTTRRSTTDRDRARGKKDNSASDKSSTTNASPVSRVKGPWTKEEDNLLCKLVQEYGPKKWSVIASHVPGRIGKQCRERWLNHLDASVKKSPWSEEEDMTLVMAQERVGNRWCEISKMLPGRPENAVKNRWNSLMNRRYTKPSSAVFGASDENTGNSGAASSNRRGVSPLDSLLLQQQRNGFAGASTTYQDNLAFANQNKKKTVYKASAKGSKQGKHQAAGKLKKRSPTTRKPKSGGGTAASPQKQLDQGGPGGLLVTDNYGNFDWSGTGVDAFNNPILVYQDADYVHGSSVSMPGNMKVPPPPLSLAGLQTHDLGDSLFDGTMHGTPKGATSTMFGTHSGDLLGSSLNGVDLDSFVKTPNGSAKPNLTSSLVGLSIDDDLGDLMHIPLAQTPKQLVNGGLKGSPRNTKPSLQIHESGDFSNLDQVPFSSVSSATFDFDINTPKLVACTSPVARDMLHVNSLHREGTISAEEKARLKTEILNK